MPDLYRTISGALFRAPNLEHNNRDHIPWNAVQERAAEKALEAEREKERQENALQHIQTLSEKTIKKLDEEISAKNITLECTDVLIEIRKIDMAEWEEKAEYNKETGKYNYSILNGLPIDFDEDELREFLYNNRKAINVTAKVSIQVNEKPVGTVFTGRKRI